MPTEPEGKVELLNRIRAEERKWTVTAAGWLVIYAGFLVVSVLFPIIIASKDGVSKSVLGDISPYVPVLALVVAAAVAIDQRLQSQNRWHWYGDDRDAARDLLIDVSAIGPGENAALRACRRRWTSLVRTHNAHRV